MIQKIGTWLCQMLRANGGISFGRAASALILLVVLTWDSAYVVFTMLHWKALFPMGVSVHDLLPPTASLLGQISFISAPYGINKMTGGMGQPDRPENGRPQ